MPNEFKQGLRKLGPSVLSSQTTAGALETQQKGGKMIMSDARGKELREYQAKVAKKQASRKAYDSKLFTKAARSGQVAYEIQLFHQFDNDGSGSLSKRELRRAMNGIKKDISSAVVPVMDGMLDRMDSDVKHTPAISRF